MKKIVLENQSSIQDVAKFAQKHGLAFHSKVEADEETPGETIWAREGAKDRLHRLDDPFSGLVYLIVEGESEDSLRNAAVEELDGLSGETLAIAMQSHDDTALSRPAIAALGVLAPSTSQDDYLGIFRWLLRHKDAAVRDAAISATGYAGWPELVPELQYVVDNDPQAALRDYAKVAIETIADAEGAGSEA